MSNNQNKKYPPSKQVAIATPIYKANSQRTPADIVGIKIFPLDPTSQTPRPDFTQTAFLIWKRDLNGVLLAGISAKVTESVPYAKTT